MTPSSRPSAVVVGAGIAGLSAAFVLAQRGFQVTVYEKEKTAGGNLGATLSHPRRRRASNRADVFEVYPHMFGDWYANFWQLMEAIGRGKEDRETWRMMSEFKFLPKPDAPEKRCQPGYKTLSNNGALANFFSNLFSGIIPAPDMFLASYAALGLLADDFTDRYDVNVATLNDFLNTRFYGSKYVTQFYQMVILYIWSLDADESSVYACQRFFQYQFRRPTPTAWVLNSGDAYTSIILPLVHHLQTQLNVKFCFDSAVVAASLNAEKTHVEQLLVIKNTSAQRTVKRVPKNVLQAPASAYVFAVPPETLSALVQTPVPPPNTRRGLSENPKVTLGSNTFGILTTVLLESSETAVQEVFSGEASREAEAEGVVVVESAASVDGPSPRSALGSSNISAPGRPAIVEAIPELATTKTFSAEPIPVLYVAFENGADINALIPPDCYIGLTDSNYALTVVEITREFRMSNPSLFSSDNSIGMVIALAASDYGELPFFRSPPAKLDRSGQGDAPASMNAERYRLEEKTIDLLLDELRKYLPFQNQDIEWCFFRSNHNHRIFLNDVESARNPVRTTYLRPENSRPILANLTFAGDFCSQDVVMSTIEAAVESGIRAALQLEPGPGRLAPAGEKPLTLRQHQAYPKAWITSSKLLLMPYAVLAKSCSDFNLCLQAARRSQTDPSTLKQELLPQVASYWPRQASMCLGAYQEALLSVTSLATQSMIRSSELVWSLFSRR
ncbi:MAG: oleate hydratase [Cyanobacteriota bacterium]|nr:oleate hydratase [Cyanobacteriota bacterium]